MGEIYVAYRPLVFPELQAGEDPSRNRVSKSMLIQRMEAEANASFLKDAVVDPFEESLKKSDRERFDTGDFVIELKRGTSSGSTSWKKVYDSLRAFLDVRADDSRAASFDGVKYIEGVGYCIRVEDLKAHLGKLVRESTSEGADSITLEWPKKRKDEELPTEISLPDGSYYRVTRENGKAVLSAKRFMAGVKTNVADPYKEELTRWFEAVTGYDSQDSKKIPGKELGHDERIVEFAKGSYGQVQLVRQETPDYKNAMGQVSAALNEMVEGKPVREIRYTTDADGMRFVNIKSLATFLSEDAMRERDLIKIGSRYIITP